MYGSCSQKKQHSPSRRDQIQRNRRKNLIRLQLQWELCEAGYPVSVDGVFGSKTKTALQKFQISCELRPDGIAKFEELGKISLSPGSFHV